MAVGGEEANSSLRANDRAPGDGDSQRIGLVYAEAMRRGLPVIASAHDAAAETVTAEETGIIVDLDAAGSALCNAVVRLLGDPALPSAMGRSGQERWAQEFRATTFRARFQPVLDELLDD